MALDLVPIWTFILAVGVSLYVLLDGFDLGVGILYGFAHKDHRDVIMNSIAPIWDGNETWLILGSVGLLAAFPLAFAIIMPAVYFPIILMLIALVFRGVSFEFRFKDTRFQWFWDRTFFGGSLVATFAQGLVLGSYIQGFKVEGRAFVGTSFDFATPFSFLTGVALVFGYTLLGTGWLVLKTEGELQAWARRTGRLCLIAVLIGIVAVSIWTPFMDQTIEKRWFTWPSIAYMAPIPILTAIVAFSIWVALGREGRRRYEAWPFLGTVLLFLLTFAGMAISLWPMIVPHKYTLWEAASSTDTQMFLLIGTIFLLPIILLYTAFSYWVFRGKVKGDLDYH